MRRVKAQVFLDDHKALMEMAELCNKMYENAKANERCMEAERAG